MKNNFYKVNCQSGVTFYKNTLLDETILVNHGFSSRIGGVSNLAYSSLNLGINTKDEKENVTKNFSLFTGALNIPLEDTVLSDQVHDDKIYIADKKDCGKGVITASDIKGVDALITNQKGVALATFYADCTPILMLDVKKKVIASVHSGWRGTLLQIGKKTVQKMIKEFSSKPGDIICAIGPSIKKCHFEVNKEVYTQFYDTFGTLAEKNTKQKNDKYYIDTDAINVEMLASLNIPLKNISVCPLCTFCNNDLFFSHRADGGITGRMCAMIELK